MVLDFSVALKPNAIDRELRDYAENSPEYHYKCPPAPPYCSITPQDLYDAHRDRDFSRNRIPCLPAGRR